MLRECNFAMGTKRVLQKHLCIHHSTCVCAKPFTNIIPMAKLDIYLLRKHSIPNIHEQ